MYIVDVGRSMGERHGGRPVTDLEWAMRYVWDRITATVNMRISADGFGVFADGGFLGGYGAEDGYGWSGWTSDRW